jgi:hypothetical protein
MRQDKERETYRKLKNRLEKTHMDKFIAIKGDQLIAEAQTISELFEKVKTLNLNPAECVAFQVGKEYPEKIAIL